ncbi:hypothetical protein M404DRAFT_123152, partial [Pisolithus tinctorius Marx 270]
VLKSHFMSAKDFIACFMHTIKDFDFEPGSLILVWNSHIELELDWKTKPHYLGPMIIVQCTKGGSYMLAKLDGAVLKFYFAAFHLYPYFPQNNAHIEVTQLTSISAQDLEELKGLREEEEEGWSQSESGDQTGASSAGSQVRCCACRIMLFFCMLVNANALFQF